MRLLSKTEINKAKSIDRQREVDEGLKLAKRVDSLREIISSEESSLEKFRVETLSKIQEDIDAEITKRNYLKREVQELQKDKIEALKPLTLEWETLRIEQESFKDKLQKLYVWSSDLTDKSSKLDKMEKDLLLKENQISIKYKEADEFLQEAVNLKTEASRNSQSASNILRTAQNEAEVIYTKSKEREKWMDEREERIFNKEEQLRGQEIELAKRLSQLVDREKTLERNIKRTKK